LIDFSLFIVKDYGCRPLGGKTFLLAYFTKKKKKKFLKIFYFKLFFMIFYRTDIKNKFFKIKKNYFNIFLNKKYFKK
jgi:hypothetical protein